MNLISIQFTFVLVLVVYSWAVSGTACTSIASTNPSPLLPGLNPIDFTILDSQDEDLVIHGNTIDQKCDDASILAPGGSTFTVSSEQLLVQSRASDKLYLCSSQGAPLCTVDRYLPILNTRNGGRKFAITTIIATAHYVLGTTPPFIRLLSSPATWSSMRSSGYSFEFALAEKRNCSSLAGQINDGTASWGASGTHVDLIYTGFSSTATTHELCIQMSHSSSVIMPWVSTSALLGAADHNVFLNPAAIYNNGYIWQLEGLSSPHLLYGEPCRVFIPNHVLTMSGLKYLAIDTSSDMCSSYVNEDFEKTDLIAFNATHVYADVTLTRPPGQPGGGMASLCGNGGLGEAWVRLSSTSGGTVNYCPEGSAVFQRGDRDQCMSCGPNASNPCHGGGYCDITQEPETLLATSMQCLCYDRHFGHNCEYYDMDPPTFDKPSGSYTTKKLTVTVTAPGPFDTVRLRRTDGSIINCPGSCVIDLDESETLNATSTHINGSYSFRHSIGRFEIVTPTPSLMRTKSSTETSTLRQYSSTLQYSKTFQPTITTSRPNSATDERTPSSLRSISQVQTATSVKTDTPNDAMVTSGIVPDVTQLNTSSPSPQSSIPAETSHPKTLLSVSPVRALIGSILTVTHPISYSELTSVCASKVAQTPGISQYVVTYNASRCGPEVRFELCTSKSVCQSLTVPVASGHNSSITQISPHFQSGVYNYHSEGLQNYEKVLIGPFVANVSSTGILSVPKSRLISCSGSNLDHQFLVDIHPSSVDRIFAMASYDYAAWGQIIRDRFCPQTARTVTIRPQDFYLVRTSKLLLSAPIYSEPDIVAGTWDAHRFEANVTLADLPEDSVSFQLATGSGPCSCVGKGCRCESLTNLALLKTTVKGLQHQTAHTRQLNLYSPSIFVLMTANNNTGSLMIVTEATEVAVLMVVTASQVPVSLSSEELNCTAQVCQGRLFNPSTIRFVAKAPDYFSGNLSVQAEATANLITSSDSATLEFTRAVSDRTSRSSLSVFESRETPCRDSRSLSWLIGVLVLIFLTLIFRFIQYRLFAPRKSSVISPRKAILLTHKYYSLLLPNSRLFGCEYVAIVGKDWLLILGLVSLLGEDTTTGSNYPVPISALLTFILTACVARLLTITLFPSISIEVAAMRAPEVPDLEIDAEELRPSLASLETLRAEHDDEPQEAIAQTPWSPRTVIGFVYCLFVSSLGVTAFFLGKACANYSLKVSIVFVFDIFVLENVLVLFTLLYRWMSVKNR